MLDLRKMKICVTGGTGFVGRSLCAELDRLGYDFFTVGSSNGEDLRSQSYANFEIHKGIDVVFHLAAKCGGIGANQEYPADFIYDNLMMGLNVIEASRLAGVKKLVMAGTLCSFPQETNGPIRPEDLWSGYPEPTNAPYGIAKRTLAEVGRAYSEQYGLNVVNVMPTNMYGPGDNFDYDTSHVIPAMIRRFTEAKELGNNDVVCWGSGKPTRDFLHVADAVEGLIIAAEMVHDPEPVLLGSGTGTSMRDLASMIAEAVGYEGRIFWNESKPDGQPRRVVDTNSQKSRLDFIPRISLEDGIRETAEWYQQSKERKAVA